MFRTLFTLILFLLINSCQRAEPINALYEIQQSYFHDGKWHSETREVRWIRAWVEGGLPPPPPSFDRFSLVKADLISGMPDSLMNPQTAAGLVAQLDHPTTQLNRNNDHIRSTATYYFSHPSMSKDGHKVLLVWEERDIHGGYTYVGLFEKRQAWTLRWKKKISEWIE